MQDRKEEFRKYYLRNREKLIAHAKAYIKKRFKNREEYLIWSRNYRRKYYLKNRERIRAYQRWWHQSKKPNYVDDYSDLKEVQ